jgi:hypothetical protein
MSTKVEIDTDIFQTIKGIAKDKKTTEKKLINDILKKEIKATKNKIPDYLIANKNTYNPDYDKEGKNAGFIKNIKPFDAVKLVRDMREGR